MKTKHKLIYKSADYVPEIAEKSVDLVVTSPPYPMIQMWDYIFISKDPTIEEDLNIGNGKSAFEKMNLILDSVWLEMDRVLKPGGIMCINIGDATRTLNNSFSLYPSHTRIVDFFYKKDYYVLPEILWRKQVNAPNKYMGSGMLPVGAYTTLEHEYILVLRKGSTKREFKSEQEKLNRRASAFFWEERNTWFSDIWFDIKGTKQFLTDESLRDRSAAYPFSLPYRLINMFSVKGDIVVDPFLGTGTTALAAMASARNSIGIEVVSEFKHTIEERIKGVVELSNKVIENRLKAHRSFIEEKAAMEKSYKYINLNYGFPVVSKQEVDIVFEVPSSINNVDDTFILEYGS